MIEILIYKNSVDRIFLTDWRKKSRSNVSSAADLSVQEDKTKPKIPVSKQKQSPTKLGKNMIKKNIEAAFNRGTGSLLDKLSPEDKARLNEFMSVIDKTLDGEGNEDDLLNEVISNPYDMNGREGQRYSIEQNESN